MATAVRGGDVRGVIFHSDHGGEYSGELFEVACRRLRVTQSMGRGSGRASTMPRRSEAAA
jgi:putative transposase